MFQFKRIKSLEEDLLDLIETRERVLTKEQIKLHYLEQTSRYKKEYYKDAPYPQPILID